MNYYCCLIHFKHLLLTQFEFQVLAQFIIIIFLILFLFYLFSTITKALLVY